MGRVHLSIEVRVEEGQAEKDVTSLFDLSSSDATG